MEQDHPLDHGQAESHALRRARREERIEDPPLRALRDPLAGILERELDAALAWARRQAQPSAPRHGVHRVQDEVHQRLAKSRLAPSDGWRALQIGDQVDARAPALRFVLPARTRQGDDVLDQRGHVHRAGGLIRGFVQFDGETFFVCPSCRYDDHNLPTARLEDGWWWRCVIR